MLKFIIFELLKSYVTREKKCYSDYVAGIFAALCFISLMIANYFYFYLEDSMVGGFIICSTVSLLLALVIKVYSHYFGFKAESKLPSLAVTAAEKAVPYLPALIRFVPIGLVTFTVWTLVKSRLAGLKKYE